MITLGEQALISNLRDAALLAGEWFFDEPESHPTIVINQHGWRLTVGSITIESYREHMRDFDEDDVLPDEDWQVVTAEYAGKKVLYARAALICDEKCADEYHDPPAEKFEVEYAASYAMFHIVAASLCLEGKL